MFSTVLRCVVPPCGLSDPNHPGVITNGNLNPVPCPLCPPCYVQPVVRKRSMINYKDQQDSACNNHSDTRPDVAKHPLLRLFARSAPMAKAKKRTNNSGGVASSKPASRVAAAASTVTKQQVVALEQHAECHVNVAMSPAKSATDAVELKLTFSEEQAVPPAAAQSLPAAAAAVAPCTPPPTEPAAPPTAVVTADSNITSSKQPAAATAATAAVVKSRFMPPSVVSNFGRYFELAVQVYTYPVGARAKVKVGYLIWLFYSSTYTTYHEEDAAAGHSTHTQIQVAGSAFALLLFSQACRAAHTTFVCISP